MLASGQMLRSALTHPIWQLTVGLPAMAMAAFELSGNSQEVFGMTLGSAHGLLFVGAAMVIRGAALSVIPKPAPKIQPSITGMSPYAPLKRTRPRKALPAPLPDNIIPFQRSDVQESGPELMA